MLFRVLDNFTISICFILLFLCVCCCFVFFFNLIFYSDIEKMVCLAMDVPVTKVCKCIYSLVFTQISTWQCWGADVFADR